VSVTVGKREPELSDSKTALTVGLSVMMVALCLLGVALAACCVHRLKRRAAAASRKPLENVVDGVLEQSVNVRCSRDCL